MGELARRIAPEKHWHSHPTVLEVSLGEDLHVEMGHEAAPTGERSLTIGSQTLNGGGMTVVHVSQVAQKRFVGVTATVTAVNGSGCARWQVCACQTGNLGDSDRFA